MRSICCVKLQLADEKGVVHLRQVQDRPSASTNLPRQKYIPSFCRNDKNKGVVEVYKHRTDRRGLLRVDNDSGA